MSQTTTPTIDTTGIQSYRIGVKKNTRWVEPPLFSFSHGGRSWFPEQLAIVGAALNAGLFYEDDIQAVCRQHWLDAHPAHDQCLTLSEGSHWLDAPKSFEARQVLRTKYEDMLKAAPRGTWYAYRQVTPAHGDQPEHVQWHASIAAGNGHVHMVQGARLRSGVTFQLLQDDMVRMEVYGARQAEQFRREHLRSGELIAEHGWHVGDTLRSVTVAGIQYSSGVIQCLGEGDTRFVQLSLTKRGSSKRWNWKGVAQSIQLQGQPHAEGAVGSLQVTDATTGLQVAMNGRA